MATSKGTAELPVLNVENLLKDQYGVKYVTLNSLQRKGYSFVNLFPEFKSACFEAFILTNLYGCPLIQVNAIVYFPWII